MLAGLVVAAIGLPFALPWYFRFMGMLQKPLFWTGVLLYAALVPAAVACISLLRLLGNVRAGSVFQPTSARYLRLLSWCCFFECAIFAALSFWFVSAPFIALGVGFIGLMLRVVKNVIEEGTRIKSENDFTV